MMKLSEVARALDLERSGDDVTITGVAPLEMAGPGDLTFAGKKSLLPRAVRAAAVVVPPELTAAVTGPALVSATPAVTLGQVGRLLGMAELTVTGIHPSAVIDPSARLAEGVTVGPLAVVGPEVVIGPGTVIHAGAVIHARCLIGARCIIHSNVVVGGEGFGYEPGPRGLERIPHFGIVRIEDDVEIGACTTIDRARFGATVVGAGTKIDNLVQIAHNVQIGPHSVIVSQVGIAGSARLGSGVQVAGQAGIGDHCVLGDGVKVAASTGVPPRAEVPPGTTWGGWWGQEYRKAWTEQVALRKLPDFMKRVEEFLKKAGA
ncbi:MAG: UDP-3-O-(3-hydroxymyristoyl)glucosamine N-acyltransferase [Magnetococcales bacterium]|nr:UDP-3-O-(3-hydroxymyristoyl)glucosamine N-acyltransferase [Magnetococcales bacterium]